MIDPPVPAAVDYPRLAGRAIPGSDEERILAEIDRWRKQDADDRAIYDIETEDT